MLEAYIIIVLLGVALFVFLRIDMKKRWEKHIVESKTLLSGHAIDRRKCLVDPLTEEQPPLEIPKWIDDLLDKVEELGIYEKQCNLYAVRVDGNSPSIRLWLTDGSTDVAVFVEGELVSNLITDQRVKKYLNEMVLRIVLAHKEDTTKRKHEESVRTVKSSLAMIGITNVDIK